MSGYRRVFLVVPALVAACMWQGCTNDLAGTIDGRVTAAQAAPILIVEHADRTLESGTTLTSSQAVQDGYTLQLRIRNTGNAELRFADPPLTLVGDEAFSLNGQPNPVLPRGAATTFTVTYTKPDGPVTTASTSLSVTPTNAEAFTCTIERIPVLSEMLTFSIGSESAAVLPGEYYEISPLMRGTSSEVGVLVDNISGIDLILEKPTAHFSSPTAWSVTDSLQTVIPAGTEDASFTVRFAPAQPGFYEETLVVGNASSQHDTVSFDLAGTATEWYGTTTVTDTSSGGRISSVIATDHSVVLLATGHSSYLSRYHSNDGGETYVVSELPTPAGDENIEPHTHNTELFAAGEIIYSVFQSDYPDDQISVGVSVDYGETFAVHKAASSGSSQGWVDGTGIGGKPLVVYYHTGTSSLHAARGTPLGDSWTTAEIDNTDDVGSYCSVAAEGDLAAVSYYDATNEDLKVALSHDAGATWAAEDVHTVDADGVTGTYTSTAVLDGTVYVLYADSAGSVNLATIENAGTDSSTRVLDDGITACKGTAIECEDGTLYIAYHDGPAGTLWFGKSTDGGSMFSTVQISDTHDNGQFCDLSGIGTEVYLSYLHVVDEGYTQYLKLTKSIDGGQTWK